MIEEYLSIKGLLIAISFIGAYALALTIGIYMLVKAALRTVREIQAYELFFADTVEDLAGVIELLETLTTRRQMLSDDPDVQNVYKCLVIAFDILTRYVNAKDRKKQE